jgi:hypothetical protein
MTLVRLDTAVPAWQPPKLAERYRRRVRLGGRKLEGAQSQAGSAQGLGVVDSTVDPGAATVSVPDQARRRPCLCGSRPPSIFLLHEQLGRQPCRSYSGLNTRLGRVIAIQSRECSFSFRPPGWGNPAQFGLSLRRHHYTERQTGQNLCLTSSNYSIIAPRGQRTDNGRRLTMKRAAVLLMSCLLAESCRRRIKCDH